MKQAIWPKNPPVLTPEQSVAREKFMQLWHEILPSRYLAIEKFNHEWVAKLPHHSGGKTIEIGAGLGAHMKFESLTDQDYHCLELRQSFCDQLAAKMPAGRVLCGDIQAHVPVADETFARAIAIHVLEHLPNLPGALAEVRRILKPNGIFDVVIPCEGGMAYGLARKISAKRIFEKKFKMSYTPIIKSEHVSEYPEIIELLRDQFNVLKTRFWPLGVPLHTLNLCVGLRLQKKPSR